MLCKSFSVTQGRLTLNANVQMINADMVVVLTGGDVPHVGTVSSYSHIAKETDIYRFYSHDGRRHKDDALASLLYGKLQQSLIGNLVVVSGFHVNHIHRAEIQVCLRLAVAIGQKIATWLSQQDDYRIEKPIYYNNSHEIDE